MPVTAIRPLGTAGRRLINASTLARRHRPEEMASNRLQELEVLRKKHEDLKRELADTRQRLDALDREAERDRKRRSGEEPDLFFPPAAPS
jgi:hypothetical protein